MLNNKSRYLLTYFSRDFEDIMSKYHMNEIIKTLMWVQKILYFQYKWEHYWFWNSNEGSIKQVLLRPYFSIWYAY